MNASPTFNSSKQYQQPHSMKTHNFAPKIRFCSSNGVAFRQIPAPSHLPSFLPQSVSRFAPINHSLSQGTSIPYQNLQASHQNQLYSLFPHTNPTGYRNQDPPSLAYKTRGQFQPLRRTEQTASELSMSVVEEPLILQDLVDFEG